MNRHASINRLFRLVRNEALGTWVPVAETRRARGKRGGRSAALLATSLAALSLAFGAPANAGGPATGLAPSPTQLPTGGIVVAGAATITPGTAPPDSAVLNIDQSTQRAILEWNTFNLGNAAQVNFNQPDAASATLNRVLDSNPSQILGKITANGQIFLTNPNGVYFGKSASVDAGGIVASANSIGNADFMAGAITLSRDGATGSVVNEGELRATIAGYVALLAPEVRNNGVVIARLGTVAMASGESITLNLDGNHLAGISVKPSAIAALVENRGAVLAPGGLIILSAQALDRLQGGVVNNSGALEATGLSNRGGRIMLEASDSVENSGAISADAGVDGSPAGSVTITAPLIENSGTISAAATDSAAATLDNDEALATPLVLASVARPVSGGDIALTASKIIQMESGSLDASGNIGGSVTLQATQDLAIAGLTSAAGTDDAALDFDGRGGAIALITARNATLTGALIDASGHGAGGQILVQGGGAPRPSDPPAEPFTVTVNGTQLRTSSRRGRGGGATVTGEWVASSATVRSMPRGQRAEAMYSSAAASMEPMRSSPMHAR